MSVSPGSIKVLIVDDEPQIRRALRVGLGANGFVTVEAATGQEALDRAATDAPDVIVLDLMLPDMEGDEVCRRLREWSQTPVIVLSVQDDVETKVRALDQGADDYLTKPFSMQELVARVRVALRHRPAASQEASRVTAGDVVIDFGRRMVTKGGAPVHLTPTEYAILRYLAVHPDRVVTHGQLLRSTMGGGYESAVGSLRVFVASLRKKLEDDPANPVMVVTEPGVGYRFSGDPSHASEA